MKKAFFVNGGAGRVLCAIPALERCAEKDDDFIIVAEAWMELYSGSPKLRDRVFHVQHNHLFEEHLRDREIVTLEPYHVNEYYNQKCNLIQAFDILINGREEILPAATKITCELSKQEQIDGHVIVNEVSNKIQKEKIIVFQPFGSGHQMKEEFMYDSSGRSFEPADAIRIVEELKKDYGIILMSQFPLDPNNVDTGQQGYAWPQNLSLRQWMGIINAADFFLGCDSLGQHIAHALGKPTTVVIGSTFPENITYGDDKNFEIIDLGAGKRKYSPIRIQMDDNIDRNNEGLMVLEDKDFDKIIKSVKSRI